ncbi:MAG TPA: hypothetical protein VEK73_11905 [Xanthobacteraceae bacterium]|nr:hypothetical protein [Xanthobacteraceae bacterium]
MGLVDEVSDAALARARRDPAFRQQLLATSLDRLLAALYKRQHEREDSDPALARQLREGAQLATRLANIIRDLDEERTRASPAAGS